MRKIAQKYTHDSILINQHFKQSKNTYFESNYKVLLGYTHPVADLIQLIFNGKKVEMMLNLNEMFTQTVYRRIKQEIDQCYLIYPKTDTFKRHIMVKGESSEQLKMIPYSFTFCNREKKS